MSETEFLKSLEEAVAQIEAEGGSASGDAAEFVSFDEHVDKDLELIRSVELQRVTDRLRGTGDDRFDREGRSQHDAWRAQLTPEQVAAYSYAIAAMLRSVLLDSVRTHQETYHATLRIVGLAGDPCVEIVPHQGSLLERENGKQQVRMSADRIAHQLAARCGSSSAWASFAWRGIVRYLPELDSSFLPRLDHRSTSLGTIEVRLEAAEGQVPVTADVPRNATSSPRRRDHPGPSERPA